MSEREGEKGNSMPRIYQCVSACETSACVCVREREREREEGERERKKGPSI